MTEIVIGEGNKAQVVKNEQGRAITFMFGVRKNSRGVAMDTVLQLQLTPDEAKALAAALVP